MERVKLAVSMGDYNGIGPEIIIKAFADQAIQNLGDFTLWGVREAFEAAFESFKENRPKYHPGLDFVLQRIKNPDGLDLSETDGISPGEPSLESGTAARLSLLSALLSWKNGDISGVVTAPVMKETFFPEDSPFNGQTEWIADIVGSGTPLMVMVAGKLRIALVTTHISVRDVPDAITEAAITGKGRILFESLCSDFGIENPKIAVCALNPHAGESGRFGSEDESVVFPAVESLRKLGGSWEGPVPADTLFVNSSTGKFDGILAMYHDQGLIPAKIYSGMQGVNFTAGLPLIRTSPDHGTAMNIAGKDRAGEESMKEAIRLAAEIAERRAGIPRSV